MEREKKIGEDNEWDEKKKTKTYSTDEDGDDDVFTLLILIFTLIAYFPEISRA